MNEITLDQYKGSNIEKGFIETDIQKGGKRAQVGEVRTYQGKRYRKEQDGSWTNLDGKRKGEPKKDKSKKEDSKKQKRYKEKELKWVNAVDVKVGDIHQYDDSEDGESEENWKIAKVVATNPLINGFGETIGAKITWDDGSTGRYTGDLQIQPRK